MSRKYITLNKARGTKNKTGDWRNDYDWTDKNDHPVEDEFKPKVLKDQLVKFYKKPKKMKNGRVSYGVIDMGKPIFPISKEVK